MLACTHQMGISSEVNNCIMVKIGLLAGRFTYRGSLFWGFYKFKGIACVQNSQLNFENQLTHSDLRLIPY